MSILIYLPGKQGANPQHLVAAGLGALVGQPGLSWSFADVLQNGPDGGAGLVCYWGERGGVLPGQTWKAEQGSDPPRFWIGWDSRPTPDDMARPKQHAGELVTLADGQAWLVPIARQLPHVNGIAPGGGFVRKVKREYAAFYQAAEETLVTFLKAWELETGRITWDQEKCWPFSCAALAHNYFLTPEIIDALELLEDQSHFDIAAVVTRLTATMDALTQKKTDNSLAAVSS